MDRSDLIRALKETKRPLDESGATYERTVDAQVRSIVEEELGQWIENLIDWLNE